MTDTIDRQGPPTNSPQLLPRSPDLMAADDTLLLLVDVQERLLTVQPDAKQIVWNCRRLLDAARALGMRSAATEQVPQKLGPTTDVLRTRLSADCFAKATFSCCGASQIADVLADESIARVLVCGIETHVCVFQTVSDILAAGYQVFVAADAVGSRHAIDHEFALRRLELSGAVLTTTEAAMFEWCETTNRPEFKQISALAKETFE